jgi:hypothetical protein
MGNKSPKKDTSSKKPSKSIKEKRADKRQAVAGRDAITVAPIKKP